MLKIGPRSMVLNYFLTLFFVPATLAQDVPRRGMSPPLSLPAPDAGLNRKLAHQMAMVQATEAAEIILDARTGRIVRWASLDAYDGVPDGLNHVTDSRYAFALNKMIILSGALESRRLTLVSRLWSIPSVRYGKFEIQEARINTRSLTLSEAYVRAPRFMGGKVLDRIGNGRLWQLLDRLGVEQPKHRSDLMALNIALGHNLAETPLQAALAASALINGGLRLQWEGQCLTCAHVVRSSVSRSVRLLVRGDIKAGVKTVQSNFVRDGREVSGRVVRTSLGTINTKHGLYVRVVVVAGIPTTKLAEDGRTEASR